MCKTDTHTCEPFHCCTHQNARDYSFYLDRRMSFLEFSACRQFFTLLGNFVTIILLHLLYCTHSRTHTLPATRSLLQLSECQCVVCVCVCGCVWEKGQERANERETIKCEKLMIEYMIAALKSFNCCLLILAKVNVVLMMCWFCGV